MRIVSQIGTALGTFVGVSENSGTPKWMGENNGKPYFFNGWFGGTTIFGNILVDVFSFWSPG